MSDWVWEPSAAYIENANVTRLMRRHGIEDFHELVGRSQEDIEWFWQAAIEDLGIEFFKPYERILDQSGGPQWPQWFAGGEMNLTYNCVDRHAKRTPDAAALVWEGEEGAVRTLDYAATSEQVNRVANGLLQLGIARGDVVAVYMPMVPEAVIAMYVPYGLGDRASLR
jgi:acetyl-CoA synthetase